MIRPSLALCSAVAIAGACVCACDSRSGEPFGSAVVEHTIGRGGGYGEEKLPDVVLGPPRGMGEGSGNTDSVLSLGQGGFLVLELGVDVVDGDGADLLVFENAFVGFGEPGEVSLSADGESWATFACEGREGCAGFAPVYAHPDNDIDPTDPATAGGDAFDLADVGLERARYVRVVDVASGVVGEGGTAGFDLDAVAVVHPAP